MKKWKVLLGMLCLLALLPVSAYAFSVSAPYQPEGGNFAVKVNPEQTKPCIVAVAAYDAQGKMLGLGTASSNGGETECRIALSDGVTPANTKVFLLSDVESLIPLDAGLTTYLPDCRYVSSLYEDGGTYYARTINGKGAQEDLALGKTDQGVTAGVWEFVHQSGGTYTAKANSSVYPWKGRSLILNEETTAIPNSQFGYKCYLAEGTEIVSISLPDLSHPGITAMQGGTVQTSVSSNQRAWLVMDPDGKFAKTIYIVSDGEPIKPTVRDYTMVMGISSGSESVYGPQAKLLFADGTDRIVDLDKDYTVSSNGAITRGDLVTFQTTGSGQYQLTAASAQDTDFDDVAVGSDVTVTGIPNSSAVGYINGYPIADDAVIFLQHESMSYRVITGAQMKQMKASDFVENFANAFMAATNNKTGTVVNLAYVSMKP